MSDPIKLVVLGSRIFAEEVADLVGECREFALKAFAENWDRDRAGSTLLGLPIIWVDDLAPLATTHQAVCAIGTTKRVGFIDKVTQLGFRFAIVQHPTARVSPTAVLGPGTIIGPGVMIGARTTLGHHVIVNRGSLIGHHTVIDDGVTICPGANIAGCVRIGCQAYIGMGAVILDRVTIGAGAVIGAGAIVAKDVGDHAEVVGVPARLLRDDVEAR